VTIFSKRVDLTYKEALSLGSYAPAKLGGEWGCLMAGPVL
jgi:hypothetical protein